MNKSLCCKLALLSLWASLEAWASLSVHPNALRDTAVVGQTRQKILHLTNVGPTTPLSYTVGETVGWLSVWPTSGQIAIGETVSVTITFDASNMTPGAYNTTVTVGDPHHGPVLVPVDLIVMNITAIGVEESGPSTYELKQNYPNPFNPSTQITYELPANQLVTLKAYNLIGQEIATLVRGEQSAGTHTVVWNASMHSGGVYFYRLQAGPFAAVKRMLLVK